MELSPFEFTHFGSAKECDIYLRNNRHITISHLCCGGTGYAVSKMTTRPMKCKTSKGTCDICFLDDVTLHHTCTSCKQPFCMDCLQKLPNKICPNCRSRLK